MACCVSYCVFLCSRGSIFMPGYFVIGGSDLYPKNSLLTSSVCGRHNRPHYGCRPSVRLSVPHVFLTQNSVEKKLVSRSNRCANLCSKGEVSTSTDVTNIRKMTRTSRKCLLMPRGQCGNK